MYDRLDPRAVKRVSGPAWQDSRHLFGSLHSALVGVSPTTGGSMTAAYVKYTDSGCRNPTRPYAVVWMKKAGLFVIGLALPPDFSPPFPSAQVPGHFYAGLTFYLVMGNEPIAPDGFSELATLAHEFVRSRPPAA